MQYASLTQGMDAPGYKAVVCTDLSFFQLFLNRVLDRVVVGCWTFNQEWVQIPPQCRNLIRNSCVPSQIWNEIPLFIKQLPDFTSHYKWAVPMNNQ